MQRTWSDGSATAEVAAQFIKPNDRLDSFERLQIYNQQYWWRLLGNFAEDFRGLRAVLGERKFDRLAVAYLESLRLDVVDLARSRQPAGGLPPRASANSPRRTPRSRSTWSAWNGRASSPLTVRRSRALDPQRVRDIPPESAAARPPALPHSARTRASDRRAARKTETAIGDRNRQREQRRFRARPRRRRRLTARPSRQPIYLAVHRQRFSVYYKRLEPEAYRLLCALRAGAPLDQACVVACEGGTDAPEVLAAKVQAWFGEWMRFGWLTRPS